MDTPVPADSPLAPRTRRLFGIAAVGIGLVLALGLAEVALRLFAPQPVGPSHLTLDADLGVIPKPGLSGTVRLPGIYTYTFHHDAHGFRETPTSTADSTAPEVLILGDSFAYGMGVEDDQTAASQLAGGLSARGMDVRVTNAARIGAGPGYALRLLQTRGRLWRPEVVVYLFCYNDYANLQHATYFDVGEDRTLTPVSPRDTPRQTKTRWSQLPGAYTLQSHSHVAGLVRRVGVGLFGERQPGPSTFDLDTLNTPLAYSEPHRQWLNDVYMEALKAEVESRGGRFLAFYIPSAAEVAAFRRTGVPTEDQTAFTQMLSRQGIDGLAFTEPLAQTGEPIARLYYPEIHWRPLGLGVAAGAMLDPVQAAVCTQTPEAEGCATAPTAVRQIVEMRAGRGSGG